MLEWFLRPFILLLERMLTLLGLAASNQLAITAGTQVYRFVTIQEVHKFGNVIRSMNSEMRLGPLIQNYDYGESNCGDNKKSLLSMPTECLVRYYSDWNLHWTMTCFYFNPYLAVY